MCFIVGFIVIRNIDTINVHTTPNENIEAIVLSQKMGQSGARHH